MDIYSDRSVLEEWFLPKSYWDDENSVTETNWISNVTLVKTYYWRLNVL